MNFRADPLLAMVSTGPGVFTLASTQWLPYEPGRQQELIGRIVGRDQRALAEFYDQTCALVFGLVRRILQNPSLAEEITLDVYSQVWREADRYDPARGAPATWLLMMARTRAIDCLRSLGNSANERPLDAAKSISDGCPDTEEILMANERCEAVRSALASLTSVQREMIELSYYSGLSHSEIAVRIGQPLGTVKSHIRMAMTRLRDLLRSETAGS